MWQAACRDRMGARRRVSRADRSPTASASGNRRPGIEHSAWAPVRDASPARSGAVWPHRPVVCRVRYAGEGLTIHRKGRQFPLQRVPSLYAVSNPRSSMRESYRGGVGAFTVRAANARQRTVRKLEAEAFPDFSSTSWRLRESLGNWHRLLRPARRALVGSARTRGIPTRR